MKIKKPLISKLITLQTKILKAYPDLKTDKFKIGSSTLTPLYKERKNFLPGFVIIISCGEQNFKALDENFNNILLLLKDFLFSYYPGKIFYYKERNLLDNADAENNMDKSGYMIEIERPKEYDIRNNNEIIWRQARITIRSLQPTENRLDDKIVQKEQWCVGITTSGSYSHQVGIQGPFNSELEAKIFADIWNRKRDEFIDKTIEENPDEELEFPYLLAKPYKLEVSEKNLVIMDEMISSIEAGINKIQG